MDISKRKVRLSLERLETREVPAQLGQIVALPYAARPALEVTLAVPTDLGQGQEGSKLEPSQNGSTAPTSCPEVILHVSPQDVSAIMRVGKASPLLNS